jgi:polyvinyl alcohol dehydrogenase (cytochrome)
MLPTLVFAIALAQAANGQALFESNCSMCHTAAGDARTPSAATLRQRTPEAILQALTTGPMREQGADLSDAQRRAIAQYLGAASSAAAPAAGASAAACAVAPAFDPEKGPRWTAWGPRNWS